MERKESIKEKCDVFVIGGGPGGSCAATLLAHAGLKVVLAEREPFPRFRLGESLIPMINPLLEKLGVWEKLHEANFIRKYGAEFYNSWGTRRVHNVFAKGMIPGLEYTFQVDRARFDHLLLQHAAESGVSVVQPASVKGLVKTEEGYRISLKYAGEVRSVLASYVVDASGREALSGRSGAARRDELPYPKRMAVYNHFTHVTRATGREAGNIIIVRLPKGWFWFIPIDSERTSVGAVTEMEGRMGDAQEHFDKLKDQSPIVSRLMKSALPCMEWKVTTDYCYSHTEYASDRLVRVGDSAGFIDPVFSSGVFLAMESAFEAAKILSAAARSHRTLSAREQEQYTHGVKKGVKAFRRLIETFYDDAGFALFMQPTERFGLFPAVNSVVAGNTKLEFSIWWRFQLFLLLCRLNKVLPLAR